jgi:hypothetical protein
MILTLLFFAGIIGATVPSRAEASAAGASSSQQVEPEAAIAALLDMVKQEQLAGNARSSRGLTQVTYSTIPIGLNALIGAAAKVSNHLMLNDSWRLKIIT